MTVAADFFKAQGGPDGQFGSGIIACVGAGVNSMHMPRIVLSRWLVVLLVWSVAVSCMLVVLRCVMVGRRA